MWPGLGPGGGFRYSGSGDLLEHSERRFGCFKMILVLLIAAVVVLAIIFLLRVVLHV
jgi:hypothetical protein